MTTDLGVEKDTKITESMAFNMRFEMFNVFNHTNFLPSSSLATLTAASSVRSPRCSGSYRPDQCEVHLLIQPCGEPSPRTTIEGEGMRVIASPLCFSGLLKHRKGNSRHQSGDSVTWLDWRATQMRCKLPARVLAAPDGRGDCGYVSSPAQPRRTQHIHVRRSGTPPVFPPERRPLLPPRAPCRSRSRERGLCGRACP